MAQEMTLSVYLQQRGKKAKALTRVEAEVFGIPFPLLAGWPRRHGAMVVTEEMMERIEAAATGASRSENRAARRSGQRAAAALPSARRTKTVDQRGPALPVTVPELTVAPSFPGFILRPAKRHRRRSSAPWKYSPARCRG